VLKVNKNDLEAIPGLVIAYSSIDPKQAEKYSSRLPPPTEKNIDVSKLEAAISLTGVKANKQEGGEVNNKDAKKEKEKKKKKKKILPKDLTKPVDPERWIPLKQRSYYKRKQRKGKLDKGAQGGVGVGRSVQLEKGKTTDKTTEKEKTTTTTSPLNSPPNERKKEEEVTKDDKPKVPPTGAQAANAKKKQKRKRR